MTSPLPFLSDHACTIRFVTDGDHRSVKVTLGELECSASWHGDGEPAAEHLAVAVEELRAVAA